MICAIRKNEHHISLQDISRIRSWFLSKENKELTKIFLYFMKSYIDILDTSMDIEMLFNTYFLLLENGMLDEKAFGETLKKYAEEGM